MAGLHLVTGYKGTAHITSADQGLFNAMSVGVHDYVFTKGRRFEAEIVSNNLVRIYDGCLMMNGRQVDLSVGEVVEVNIPNGTQGMNRNDLIVARYSKDETTGIEDVTFAVIQGASVEETPTDPAHNANSILDGATIHDMPLYRVKLSGLNIEGVEPVFEVLAPMAEVQKYHRQPNMLINGDFQINQRGETTYDASATVKYTVDMWRAYHLMVDVAKNGVKLTGTSTTAQGYFTQFIQLGKLKTTPYTICARVDGKVYTFTETPGANAKEKDFGTFKLSLLTTSTWDNDLGDYNNKLKINILPNLQKQSITVGYVDVFEGDIAYPHVKEDFWLARNRCRQYVQRHIRSVPITYRNVQTNSTKYYFDLSFDPMVGTPTWDGVTYTYYNNTTAYKKTVSGYSNPTIVSPTHYRVSHTFEADPVGGLVNYGVVFDYVLTCEPTDA